MHYSEYDCEGGTKCGRGCISKMFQCLAELSPEASAIGQSLVALARTARMTSHTGSLYTYVDDQGKSWFAKKFDSADQKSWQSEARAYKTAQKLGISKMLVTPKFVNMGSGQVMAVWPKLEGSTLRDHLASGGKITQDIRLGLAIARQFDEAISNPDRNAGNVWVTPGGKIKLIDHDQAFGSIGCRTHASNMTLKEAREVYNLGSRL